MAGTLQVVSFSRTIRTSAALRLISSAVDKHSPSGDEDELFKYCVGSGGCAKLESCLLS